VQKLSAQGDFKLIDCEPDKEPLKFMEANCVDVVLLERDYPISKGLELGRAIAKLYPNIRVIILSSCFNDCTTLT
jgi:DNA-binding NarL/FixJ family response regulator